MHWLNNSSCYLANQLPEGVTNVLRAFFLLSTDFTGQHFHLDASIFIEFTN